ncbi:Fanconi anemia group J protein [Actinidia chinensis var. chinensis]|uniref:DNA 5'-3' helicase FANCJ n=1 Tax=Actinidia chinensis var. chinensis TaxID=1590841 RepID=A0A2R6RMC4_ACTCC|nr:Fanconi anemia group J protein [Actinidia chinensis var. chinensis]
MDSSKPMRNPKKISHHIGGIAVEFPYQPYGSQMAFMGRVISTLDRAQRDGHCHALLESPTGTGKSLSLLCSVLAWQKNYQSRNIRNDPAHLMPAPEAKTDPLGHGGGFIPETQPSEPVPSATNNKSSKKKTVPTIFYASRTHTQITQVIREYRKTTYRVPMAVLASRKHYCTNRHVHGKDNIDEECKLLLNDRVVGCSEFKNVHKVKGHSSLNKGGSLEVHDIEDLVKVGQEMKGCSYFAARSMAEDAQLVFCPYSYLVNPVIRKAMEVDIRGAILILDEAHNIEDIARDGGSVNVDEDVLHKLQTELGQLTFVNPTIYQPLNEMIQDITSWMERRKSSLEKREFQHYFSCWSGDKALRELQEANISRQCFPILQECATKAIKAASDAELEIAHLTGMSATTLEGLVSSLSYFFSGNGAHIHDYQLVLQRYVKRNSGNVGAGWTNTMSLWCLNPAVVFRDIADLSLSVILTSGTLSPMNSFSSELGVQFGTCLEAPHVIDVESQLWAAVISTGPGNYPLNASYKTADGYAFQDALGMSLEEICKIVPGGSLIFFPSYKLMEKLCNRWHETGQWSRLNAQKSLFVEPRGGNQDDFEPVLTGYYNSIRRSKMPALGRKRRGKKLGLGNSGTMECTENSKDGAAFLAVCRGKVSEGIDFSDENARAVIIVGIPFPNINDIQVAQKKKYNDTYKSSRNLLSGSEWYCQQAFRALNQAAGRCIRHRFDYGAVILLDERFREERNITYISKWLRKSMRQYDSFDKSVEELKYFFRDAKERVGKEVFNTVQNSDINLEKIAAADQGKGFTRNKNQKVNKASKCGLRLASNGMMGMEKTATLCQSPTCSTKYDATFVSSKSEDDVEVQASVLTDVQHTSSCREYVDLDCSQKNFRFSGDLSTPFTHEDPGVFIVKETPGMGGSPTLTSPASFSRDENSSSTIIQAPTEFADQLLLHSPSPSNSKAGPFAYTCSLVTPEKYVTADANSILAETESVLNLSVNSHTQKRRKSLGSTFVNPIQVEQFDAPDSKTPGHDSFMASSRTSKYTNLRTESGLETGCSQNEFKRFNTSTRSSSHAMDKRLQILCSICRNQLGLPENHWYVRCSITSSSKGHLVTLLKGRFEAPVENTSTGIPVVISDLSSVDQRLCNRTQGARGQGIWSGEDGCVFNTIFCPFCNSPENCLGVQVMATDASNVHLLNKILFYLDRLEIKNLEASSKEKDSLPVSDSDFRNSAVPISIENSHTSR